MLTHKQLRAKALERPEVKAQFDKSSLSGQQFTKVDMAADKSERVNVYTLGVDFIF